MRKLFVLLVALLFAGPLGAAEPTVELRIKAIKDLLPLAEYLGDLAGQGEQAAQGAKFVEAMAGKKGVIEGLDITKPIGFYATMTPAVVDSPMVVLVPVGDETAFLNLLKGKLNLAPEKGDDDIYSVAVPNVPPKVYFKFYKGYVCVTVHNKTALEEKSLLDPKDFFAEPEAAVLALDVHLDRIPAEVSKTVLGQLELKLADEKAKPAKTPVEEKAKALALDATLASVAMLGAEGKSLNLRLNVDPKSDDIGLELGLSAKDGTDLKKLFSSSASRTAVAPLAAAKDAIVSVALNVQVPESLKKKYAEVIDLAIADALENAKGNDRDGAKKFFDAIEPTLKAGILQLGLSLTPTASGKHEILSAIRVTAGKGIESLAKEFAPFIPQDQVKIKFDVENVGQARLHQVTPPSNDAVEKLFGTGSVWLTTADDLFVIGLAPDASATKKLAAKAAGPTPIASVEVSLARLMPIADQTMKPEAFKAITQEVFDGKPEGKDTFNLHVTGGDKLSVNLVIKGRGAKFLALLQQKKKDS